MTMLKIVIAPSTPCLPNVCTPDIIREPIKLPEEQPVVQPHEAPIEEPIPVIMPAEAPVEVQRCRN
jgi:hypothetical protein